MKKMVLSLVIFVLMTVCWTVPSDALTKITPTNLDDLLLDPDIIASIFLGPSCPADIIATTAEGNLVMGKLTGTVYWNESVDNPLYTYVLDVDPSDEDPKIEFASEFNTGFSVTGFTGVVGYSFADAIAASGFGKTPLDENKVKTAFSIYLEDDDTIDWNVNILYQRFNNLWKEPVKIAFFYQSTLNPGDGGCYNLYNGYAGQSVSYYPVASIPEPPIVLLIFSCLTGFGLLVKKYKK